MTDKKYEPISEKETMHPDVRAEATQRVGLYDAIKAESKLMAKVAETNGLNVREAAAAKMIHFALDHIVERWTNGTDIVFDSEKLKFVKNED